MHKENMQKPVDWSSTTVENEVVILLSDMVSYSSHASNMTPSEIQDFLLDYHNKLKEIVLSVCGDEYEIEPSAGDGAVAIFNVQSGEDKTKACNLALNTALHMVYAMRDGIIPPTRIGLFNGTILDAVLDGKKMHFGSSFTVASRLEELCDFFGTSFLMGREVAFSQTDHPEDVVSIGKITPKNFLHPIHIFTLYQPGIHNCPPDADKEKLAQFIQTKNEAVELFCGHKLRSTQTNFPLAKDKLTEAQKLFQELSGSEDLATNRLLDYIHKNPCPEEDFNTVGMKIWDSGTITSEVRLPILSNELLKAINAELYESLIEDTDWEDKFKLLWKNKDDTLFEIDDPPDGIYFIAKGSVKFLDRNNRCVKTLEAGNIFGEIAYFSPKALRTTTAIAHTDLILRKVSGTDLNEMPAIRTIFSKIAKQRRRG